MSDCSVEHTNLLPESAESSVPSAQSCDERADESPRWAVAVQENDDENTSTEHVRALARAMQERFDKEVELTNHISQGIAYLQSVSVLSDATVVAPSLARQAETSVDQSSNETDLPDTIIAPAIAATPSHAPLYTFEPSPTASPTPPPVLPTGPLFPAQPEEETNSQDVLQAQSTAVLRTHHIGGAPPVMRSGGKVSTPLRSPPRQHRSPLRSTDQSPVTPRALGAKRAATPSARRRSPSPTPNSRPRAVTPTSTHRPATSPVRVPVSARRPVSPAARSPAPQTARSPTHANAVCDSNGPRPVRFTAQPLPGDASIWTKLYQSGLSTMQLKKRREELEARRREEEEKKKLQQECTFKPAVSPMPQIPHIRGNDENVYSRLTDSEVKKQIKNKQILKERVDQQRNRECTFAPNVAPQGNRRVLAAQQQKDLSERLYRDAKARDKRRQEQAEKAAALEAMRIKAEGLIANHHQLEKEIAR